MKLFKENKTTISGNVASVDIRNGNNGPFGSVLLMVDDGYFQKDKNGNNGDGQWVDRTYPISVKVNANVIKQAGQFGFNKGDFLAVEGKNIVEFAKNQDGSPDNSKKFPKVEARTVLQHLPANVAKQLRQEIKNERQQSNNQQSNNQQNGGGGYQQNSQQRPQQQNNGGYNSNGNGGGNNGYNNNGHHMDEQHPAYNGNGQQQRQNHYQSQGQH